MLSCLIEGVEGSTCNWELGPSFYNQVNLEMLKVCSVIVFVLFQKNSVVELEFSFFKISL